MLLELLSVLLIIIMAMGGGGGHGRACLTRISRSGWQLLRPDCGMLIVTGHYRRSRAEAAAAAGVRSTIHYK